MEKEEFKKECDNLAAKAKQGYEKVAEKTKECFAQDKVEAKRLFGAIKEKLDLLDKTVDQKIKEYKDNKQNQDQENQNDQNDQDNQ